jgi:hypothetical protein
LYLFGARECLKEIDLHENQKYACDQDQVIQKDALVVTQVSKAVTMNLTSMHSLHL